jgi:hypothetical protein
MCLFLLAGAQYVKNKYAPVRTTVRSISVAEGETAIRESAASLLRACRNLHGSWCDWVTLGAEGCPTNSPKIRQAIGQKLSCLTWRSALCENISIDNDMYLNIMRGQFKALMELEFARCK